MTNALSDVRQSIVDALTAILPGRVQPYRPSSRPAAPCLWVDSSDGNVIESVVHGAYVVVGVVDGADHAQQALVEEMISRTWDACKAAGLRPRGWQSRDIPIPGDDQGKTMRGFRLTLDIGVQAQTLCPPTTVPIEVPTTALVEVN